MIIWILFLIFNFGNVFVFKFLEEIYDGRYVVISKRIKNNFFL